jgi:hypothetical protein
MKISLLSVFIYFIMGTCTFLDAQGLIKVQSIDRFDRIRKQNNLMVAYLYEINPATHEGTAWSKVDDNHMVLEALSKRLRYRKTITFVSANLLRDDLQQLKQRYNLTQENALLLFKGGSPYRTARLTGLFDTAAVRTIIESNFGDFIDDVLDEQEIRAQKLQREERQNSYRRDRRRPERTTYVTYAPYWGPPGGYYGYAYPYYGYYGYYGCYGRRGFGFSVGF